MQFKGKRLQINVNTGASGSVCVALERPDGTVIDGRTPADAIRAHGIGLHKPVKREMCDDLTPTAGQAIRLGIQLKAARQYGFQFVEM